MSGPYRPLLQEQNDSGRMACLNKHMRAFISKLIPRFLVERLWWIYWIAMQRRNRGKPAEEVFTGIYEKKAWGDRRDEFCSGSGSVSEEIVSPYISMISRQATAEGFRGSRFVDLGCGDFRVGRRLLPLCSAYTGVDIVGPLVRRNQKKFSNETTRFLHRNIVKDELPDGEVCFLRQVLQHLSNRQIAAILGKLGKYGRVYITEHYPTDNGAIRPNIDKIHGQHIRLYDNSGVYLDEPPFALPGENVTKVLEVPGTGLGEGTDQGVIRTFLYKPRDHLSRYSL